MIHLALSLLVSVGTFARADEYEFARRRELIGLSPLTRLDAAPAVLLTWPTLLEPAWTDADRAAAIEDVLRLERAAASHLRLTRVELREVLDLTLRPSLALRRALDGRLHRFGPNRFDDAVRAELLKRIDKLRPALARELRRDARDFGARPAVLAALDLVEWRGHQLPLTIGFRDDDHELPAFAGPAWRDHRLELLKRSAAAHVVARGLLRKALIEIERLPPSTARAAWLVAIGDVIAELDAQVSNLPARIDRLVEIAEDHRRLSRRQEQRPERSWERLNPEPFSISTAEWAEIVRDVANEVDADLARRCARSLGESADLRP